MRGVDVGKVVAVGYENHASQLELAIAADQIRHIPANVQAQISATTAFGNKYVELIYPEDPSPKRLSAGEVLHSRNVSTEVNTVFENLVNLLDQVDPAKLNGILSALAEGLRGQGQTIGGAITDANEVLSALVPRSETVRQDLRALSKFSDTYGLAAPDILTTVSALSTTSETLTSHADRFDALLLNVIGLSTSGLDVIDSNKESLIRAINILEPTTSLLLKYNPEYTCMLLGANILLKDAYPKVGGNGYSLLADAAVLLGNDPYLFPDNLPIVAAKGGPGGKPGCGSLPDVSKNFPVRQLVTNTGWGTGMDIRPNPGLGHPCWANFFPVTRAQPQPPSYRCVGPPSPGLVVPATGPLPFPPP
jgi:phospholipid/cholesterol/gamma-HCH transport system substrate-binding protein